MDQMIAEAAGAAPNVALGGVVAVVPAKDSVHSIGGTVAAVAGLVDHVVVVDDGSTDGTAEVASTAGAHVVVLPRNRGKGDAVATGVAYAPQASTYLLVDADVQGTAAAARPLLDAVAGGADMAIGVLPPAGGRGGFGAVKRVARAGIRRACGLTTEAPLSGQRAVRGDLLRQLTPAPRFGLEVGLTIDAVRSGAQVVEVPVGMDHEHTGRSLAGFRHRARQGRDVLTALWFHGTRFRFRVAVVVLLGLALMAAGTLTGVSWEPASRPLGERPDKVVIVGMSPLDFRDVGRGVTPNLDRLLEEGAVAAMSVRTVARGPSTAEGYLSLGSGSRAAATSVAATAYPADTQIDGTVAANVVESLSGQPPTGSIVVPSGPALTRVNDKPQIPSQPGALGEALGDAGLVTAVVGNADEPATLGLPGREERVSRPVALALMDASYSVGTGRVGRSLLVSEPLAPFGVRADLVMHTEAVLDALEEADVVLVDPGDLDRANTFRHFATPAAASRARSAALASTDALLGSVLKSVDDRTLVIAASVAPPRGQFRLTPVVAVGPGVPTGWLHSPSTRRPGLVTITDLAPTILDSLGIDPPDDMIGNPLRYREGDPDLDPLNDYDTDTIYRERTYFPQAVGYIVFQIAAYALALLSMSMFTSPRARSLVRWLVVGAVAYPLATFVAKAIPDFSSLDGAGPPVIVAIAAALTALAMRARRHPLSPVLWLMGATAAVIVVDAATGTWLHVSSWLGYSLHSAGRFYGVPNTTFAVLAACMLLTAAGLIHLSRYRRDAVLVALVALLVAAYADGAPPLGGDVGGILTLVPVFGLAGVAFAGGRVTPRRVAWLALATVVALVVAAGVDLLRPEEARTHLGRFAADVLDSGSDPVVDTFVRKQAANLRILRVSIWSWMIPVAAAFLLYMLVWERRFTKLLPAKSALRVGAVATMSAALLGFVTNDSGPIVIALFFAYLAPFLTLVAIADREEAVVLRPGAATSSP